MGILHDHLAKLFETIHANTSGLIGNAAQAIQNAEAEFKRAVADHVHALEEQTSSLSARVEFLEQELVARVQNASKIVENAIAARAASNTNTSEQTSLVAAQGERGNAETPGPGPSETAPGDALTTSAPEVIVTADLQALNTEQVSAISAMATAAISALATEQVGALTTEQIGALSPNPKPLAPEQTADSAGNSAGGPQPDPAAGGATGNA